MIFLSASQLAFYLFLAVVLAWVEVMANRLRSVAEGSRAQQSSRVERASPCRCIHRRDFAPPNCLVEVFSELPVYGVLGRAGALESGSDSSRCSLDLPASLKEISIEGHLHSACEPLPVTR